MMKHHPDLKPRKPSTDYSPQQQEEAAQAEKKRHWLRRYWLRSQQISLKSTPLSATPKVAAVRELKRTKPRKRAHREKLSSPSPKSPRLLLRGKRKIVPAVLSQDLSPALSLPPMPSGPPPFPPRSPKFKAANSIKALDISPASGVSGRVLSIATFQEVKLFMQAHSSIIYLSM